jgi:hypothetical protein
MWFYWRKTVSALMFFAPVWGWLRQRLWVGSGVSFAAAVQAVQVKEYAIAAAFFFLSAALLIVFAMGWSGIPNQRTVTLLVRMLLGFCGIGLIR